MVQAQALRCLRCATEYPVGRSFLGCPACRERGKPTNLEVTYDDGELRKAAARSRTATGPGIWR